jgi:hypothetical protein
LIAKNTFSPFEKFTDFGNFLSFNHIPGQIISATTSSTGIIHYWKRKYRRNAIVSSCILWYRGNIWLREEVPKAPYKLYAESMRIRYLWNKIAFCEILYLSFNFESICAFE